MSTIWLSINVLSLCGVLWQYRLLSYNIWSNLLLWLPSLYPVTFSIGGYAWDISYDWRIFFHLPWTHRWARSLKCYVKSDNVSSILNVGGVNPSCVLLLYFRSFTTIIWEMTFLSYWWQLFSAQYGYPF